MKEGRLTGRWTQGGRDKGILGLGNRRSKVMVQKVQCGLKRAVSGLVCLQGKEISYEQKEVEKEVWRSKLGQMLEGFYCLAKKLKLPLLGIDELLEIWGNRLMWHY